MDKVNAKIGTDYKLFNYYGAADADRVIIAMGSVQIPFLPDDLDLMHSYGKHQLHPYLPYLSDLHNPMSRFSESRVMF